MRLPPSWTKVELGHYGHPMKGLVKREAPTRYLAWYAYYGLHQPAMGTYHTLGQAIAALEAADLEGARAGAW